MKTAFRVLALVALLATLVLPAAAAEKTYNHTFLLFSDLDTMTPGRDGRGGIVGVASAVAAERAANPNVTVVHAGDALSPSLLSGLDRGAHMVQLLNALGLDAFAPGNHEFDFGPDVFRQRMGEATFPVLSANISGPGGAPLAGIAPYRIIDAGGLRIGIIGLTTEDTLTASSPGDIAFAGVVETAERLVPQLRREGADIVAILAHAPRNHDREMQAESGADLVLSGHNHDLLVSYDGKAVLAESMQEGRYVVAIDLTVTVDDKDGKRTAKWWPDFRVLDPTRFPPEPAMAKLVKSYQDQLSAELDREIGTTATALDSRNPSVRGGESAIGNLFADAIREATQSEIAILNGGGIRGNTTYDPGTRLTRRDVMSELPFLNRSVVLDIAGTDLRAALEQGLAHAEDLAGGFPQVSGLLIRADLSRPVGSRIVRLEAAGAPVEDGRTYRLVTNDFLARGGDGYTALEGAKVLIGEADAKLLATQVIDYITAKGTVSPQIEGRIVVAREREPREE